MEQHNRIFKGIWIPAEIWDMENLILSDKCVWAEISALSDQKKSRPCRASNGYIAKVLGVGRATVIRSVKRLLELGLIVQEGSSNHLRELYAISPDSLLNQNDSPSIQLNQNEPLLNQNDSELNQNEPPLNQNDSQVNSSYYIVTNKSSCSKKKTTTNEVVFDDKSQKRASQKRKKVAAKKESSKGLLFATTEMGQDFKVFESCFDEALKWEVDLHYYWTRALKWSNEKEVKLKDWLSQIKSWMQSDKQQNRLKLKSETPKPQNNVTWKGSIIDLEQAERVTRSILSRKNRV